MFQSSAFQNSAFGIWKRLLTESELIAELPVYV